MNFKSAFKNSTIVRWAQAFFDLNKFKAFIVLPIYIKDYLKYRRIGRENEVKFRDTYPCLIDRTGFTPFDPHYFYQAAWLARRLAEQRPDEHTDIGSHSQMISVISGFINTIFIDYRPLGATLDGLQCQAGDITQLSIPSNSIKSLSSLHVIEHIGLGRYGDPLDASGSKKAAIELSRILCPGGLLYLSAPSGRERVCFNAHRVFSPHTIIDLFSNLRLLEFTYVDDQDRFHEHQNLNAAVNCEYACGMYLFTKDIS